MQLGWVGYAVAFLVSLGLALLLTPVAVRIALRRDVLDRPGDYKVQESPVPYLGGLAIFVAFTITVFAAGAWYFATARPAAGLQELGVVLGGALLLGFVGLIDDVRSLNPLPRFLIQTGLGIAVWWVGAGALLFDHPVLNALFTLLWMVGMTNAFNLLDNMDGLSAGIAAIASFFFFLLAALSGQFLIAALSIALTGCVIGFLRHNFHPAKIYMGDAGSLFLGFLLAGIGLKLEFPGPNQITFMVPILVLGVPILDTTLVVTTRVINRINPLRGGRDHVSHRLVFVGIPVKATVSLIYGASVALGWLAIVMSRIDRASGFLLMGLVIAIALFIAILLGQIPVYESSRRRRMMITRVAEHEDPADVKQTEELGQNNVAPMRERQASRSAR